MTDHCKTFSTIGYIYKPFKIYLHRRPLSILRQRNLKTRFHTENASNAFRSSTLNRKAVLFKFLRLSECFRKASFSWWISVDESPNWRNKAGFLNSSGLVWTGPKAPIEHSGQRVLNNLSVLQYLMFNRSASQWLILKQFESLLSVSIEFINSFSCFPLCQIQADTPHIRLAIVLFILSDLFPGTIQSPAGVTIKAMSGSDFVIVSWNYQANVTLYRIFFRSFKFIRGNSSISQKDVGPMPVYCLPDNSTCSYCVSNINRRVSCNNLNSKYQAPLLQSELDFEELVSVKVEACSDYFPDTCESQSRWKNYTIPPGSKCSLLLPSKSSQIQIWKLSNSYSDSYSYKWLVYSEYITNIIVPYS